MDKGVFVDRSRRHEETLIDLEKRTVLLRRVKNSRNPHEARDIKIGLSPRAMEILQDCLITLSAMDKFSK
ncbi:hypothetical protein F9K88_01975 [Brucella intermedia]|uniref:hypothetical protein n=1 Tax=Brucella TaxID=234 RepID=UPI0007C6F315|nr:MULTISPECIES: hypothetical protein [Brucella/Ochrobactrum group]MBM7323164.1 hypothetical protein [Agrobacterium sp. S2]KAB2714379.1 hypothetical protein F9K88_01975 [Brucella intermedia]MBA8845028.1 hypothetical protein [Ochrobactrum sp. RH1CCR137]MBA8854849.1 hypothetical protein [Ochrobactrum sp. RH1CCR134]MCH6205189.1 hypothetical protein [Brucella ciceri]